MELRMTAREHAAAASRLLAGVDRVRQQLATADLGQRLELAASGAVPTINRDLDWTVALATAHATTATALIATTET